MNLPIFRVFALLFALFCNANSQPVAAQQYLNDEQKSPAQDYTTGCYQLQPGIEILTMTLPGKSLSRPELEDMIEQAKEVSGIKPSFSEPTPDGMIVYTFGEQGSYEIGQVVATIQKGVGTATFSIVNNDGINEGLNDTTVVAPVGGNPGTTLGEQRLNKILNVVEIWGDFIVSSQTIVVRVNFDPLFCSSNSVALGFAGASTVHVSNTFPATSVFYPQALANSFTNSDNSSGTADINATFNSNLETSCFGNFTGFYYGFDGNAPSNKLEMQNTVLHEICHGLGFSSQVTASTGVFLNGLPSTYDLNLFDETNSLTWGLPANGTTMTNAQRQASAINNGNLTWLGANVTSSAGILSAGRHGTSNRVRMYAPTTVVSGSSVSHFDTALSPNDLMEPIIASSLNRTLTEQLLKDIGWTTAVTPEVNVVDGGTSVADGTGSVNFGTATQGGSALSKTFTVQNLGSASLTTSALTVPSGYSITEALSASIAAGGNDNFTVQLPTTNTGSFNGTIQFTNNDSNENPYNFSVSGTINPAPAVVTNVTSTLADGAYTVGQVIPIQITFNTAVTVAGGSPLLLLETGTTDRNATYSSGSPGTTLTFNYTVQSGDTTVDLNYSSTSALTLNGASMTNGGVNVTRTLPALGAAGSLGTNKNLIIDTAAPTISSVNRQSPTGSSTNLSTVTWRVTFSEAVQAGTISTADFTVTNVTGTGTGLAVSSVNVVNGTVVDVTATGATGLATWRLDVNGTATISDTAGNDLSATFNTGQTFVIDLIQPTVALASVTPDPTNQSSIPVTILFSESVTGFVSSEVTLTNATLNGFSGSGASYSFNLVPTGQGTASAIINAGVATDSVGNLNTESTEFSRVFDSARPTVVISSTAPNPTNNATIPVTVTFNENVTGFVAGDVTIGNGTLNTFAGSGTTYTFNVLASGQGVVTVDVAANAGQDSAGNLSQAATQLSRTVDTLAPTVSISSTAPNLTNNATIPVTVTFSESVTGFVAGDVVIGNGTLNTFAGSGTTYTFNVVASGQGVVTVDVAANAAQDSAANQSQVATQLSRTVDTLAPTVSISSTAPNLTNNATIPVTVTFSESVTGFVAGDVVIGNGTLNTFAGSGTTYMFHVMASGQGVVTVDVAANAAQDSAANQSQAATQLSRTVDTVAPTVSISSTAPNPTNNATIPVTVTFSENVTGFVAGDVVISNGTLNTFAGSGTTYTFNVLANAQGEITINLAGSVAQDDAGNLNVATSEFSISLDSESPTVILNTTAQDPTNLTSIPVTVTFSESVVDFSMADLTFANSSISEFAGGGANYSFNLIPQSQGAVTVSVVENGVQDQAGNTNPTSNVLSRTFDTIAPSVEFSSTATEPTGTSPIPVTVTFSEPVTGFEVSDLTLGNSTVGNFSGSGSTYFFNLSPQGQGVVSASLAAGAAQDAAGNNSTAAVDFTRTFDSQNPTVVLTSSVPDPTNLTTLPINVLFSKPVINFEANDLLLTNSTVENFIGSGENYTFNLIPSAEGQVTVSIPAEVAQDGVGNLNLVSNQLERTIDLSAPTVVITSTASNPTSSSTIPITVTFSEPVTDFIAGDILFTNSTLTSFTGSTSTYTTNLEAVGSGTVTVKVPLSVAQDAAGNFNTASETFTIVVDLPVAKFEVFEGTTPIASSSAPLDFGTRVVGDAPTLRTFTVKSTGTATLETFSFFLSAGYSLSEDLNSTIAPNESDDFTISFFSDFPGLYDGAFQFSSNDPDQPFFVLRFTGEVVAPPQPLVDGWAFY